MLFGPPASPSALGDGPVTDDEGVLIRLTAEMEFIFNRQGCCGPLCLLFNYLPATQRHCISLIRGRRRSNLKRLIALLSTVSAVLSVCTGWVCAVWVCRLLGYGKKNWSQYIFPYWPISIIDHDMYIFPPWYCQLRPPWLKSALRQINVK